MPIRSISWESLPAANFIRAIAVVMIVCGHLGVINYGGGGALTLMLLAGFTYAKYLFPKLMERPVANERHLFLMLKIAIPKVIYQLVQSAMPGRPINWSALAFHSNLIQVNNHAAWFVEAYLQINLVLFLLAQNKRVAYWLTCLRKFGVALCFAVVCILLCTLAGVFWDTAALLDRVPYRIFWLFACGILLASCINIKQRLVFSLLTVAGSFIWGGAAPIFLIVCAMALGLFEQVRLPTRIVPTVNAVSAASLLVYLTHYWWIKAFTAVLPSTHPVILVVIGIAGGVVLQIFYNRLWKAVRDRVSLRLAK